MTAVFRYLDDDCEDSLVVVAEIGDEAAGRVTIKEHGSRQVSIGQLYVEPGWRRQGVARQLMEHAVVLFPRAEKWLFADPYTEFPGDKPGPGREVLERFYASLGFIPAADSTGRQAMVRRPD